MPTVHVFDGQFEKAMRRFKKSVANAGIMEELRDRESYEKPSTTRNRKKGAAKARYRKKLQKERNQFERMRWPRD